MIPQLTKAEEQVMHIVWNLEESTVQNILEQFVPPKPARTTIATVLGILENKGFVTHKTMGRVNVYYPSIEKRSYSKSQLFGVIKNYFNNSFTSMALFFAKETNLSIEELDALFEEAKEELRVENNEPKTTVQ